MKRYILWSFWAILPLAVGAGAAAWKAGYLSYLWEVHVAGEPILEMNSPLDLGKREYGEVVAARFAVANRGGGDLILDQFRMECACHSLEYEVNGQAIRVTNLKLAPNEERELILRFSIRNPIGSQVRNVFYCQTNDPRMPEAVFEAVIPKVTGGIFASPTSVLFGTVPIGSKRQQVVEVRDNAVRRRRIKKIVSTNPLLFSARLLGPASSESRSSAEEGILLSRIEVALDARQMGPFSGEVQVYLDDEQHSLDSISVTGCVAPIVEVSPSSILLPRASNRGPLYSATCICRCTTGDPLIVTVEKTSAGITASVSPSANNNPSRQVVTVKWKSSSALSLTTSVEGSVTLRARIDKQEIMLDLPIQIEPSVK